MRFKLIVVSKIRWKKTTQLLILALSTHLRPHSTFAQMLNFKWASSL